MVDSEYSSHKFIHIKYLVQVFLTLMCDTENAPTDEIIPTKIHILNTYIQ